MTHKQTIIKNGETETIIIERDDKSGAIIKKTISRTDGFYEETDYSKGMPIRIYTKYPDGQTELEHFTVK